MEPPPDDAISRAAEWILEARRPVAFSGAGVSAESGIATFRDPGGIWERFDPAEVGTPSGIVSLLRSGPTRLVAFLRETMETLFAAQPNPGHRALAELERLGKLTGVITQNVDDLHQAAGSSQVVELHGNAYRLRCTRCDHTIKLARDDFAKRFHDVFSGDLSFPAVVARLPRCPPCGGLMRMDVVLFGEAVQSLDEAYELAASADLMLVLGTSGTVHPAADLPAICRSGGGRIIVINPHENNFTGLGGVYLPARSGEALDELARRVASHRYS